MKTIEGDKRWKQPSQLILDKKTNRNGEVAFLCDNWVKFRVMLYNHEILLFSMEMCELKKMKYVEVNDVYKRKYKKYKRKKEKIEQ